MNDFAAPTGGTYFSNTHHALSAVNDCGLVTGFSLDGFYDSF